MRSPVSDDSHLLPGTQGRLDILDRTVVWEEHAGGVLPPTPARVGSGQECEVGLEDGEPGLQTLGHTRDWSR